MKETFVVTRKNVKIIRNVWLSSVLRGKMTFMSREANRQ